MRLESGCAERNRCALEIIINLLILISHCSKSFLEADPILLSFNATAKLQPVNQLFDEIKEGSPDLTIADYNVNVIFISKVHKKLTKYSLFISEFW